MNGDSIAEPQAPSLAELADAIVAKFVQPDVLGKIAAHQQQVELERAKAAGEMSWKTLPVTAEKLAATIIEWTSLPPVLGAALSRAATDTLLGEGGAGRAASAQIGKRVIDRIAGPGGEIAPSKDAAAAFLGLMLGEQIEAWVRGVFAELVSGLAPAIVGVAGGVETFAKLQDIVEGALGGPRMVRRVLQPFLQATAITPAQWHVNKQYHPELLSVSAAAQTFFSGRYDWEQLREELERQGWSVERIEALVAQAARTLSAADAAMAVRRGAWTRADALQHLRDQGFPLETAELALQLQDARDVEQFEEQLAQAARGAYVDRRIDRDQFTDLVHASVLDRRQANRIVELGETQRTLNIRHLSAGEARRLAFAGILAPVDYRRALEREGYDELAIAALDLELRVELQERRDLEAAREQQRLEREAEKAEREQERRRREEELQQKRARAYQSLADARRLYVRGYIPIDRYREALEAEQLPNLDVAAYLSDAEQDRADYLEALERKRELEGRERDAVVPIAQVEQSVLRGILSIVDYDRDLIPRGFDEGERRLMVNLLADRLEDQELASRSREAAAARAAARFVSLDTFERAVRLGVRTRAQYAAFLAEIGTPAPAAALILDSLDAELRRDVEARAARDQAAAAAAQRGISLEQRARAVRAGVRPLEYYAAGLVESGIAVADQQVLLELLEVETAAAAEARRRRDELVDQADDPELPLSTIERAVKLGALPPAALRDRALARGLSEADADLLVQLVVADVPSTREAQRREQTIAQELTARGISYADEKALVQRGIRSLEQHAAWLEGQRYGADDQALLLQLLEEEIAADVDGLRKRIAAKLEKADGAPSIDAFVDALRAGELDVPGLVDALASWEIDRDQALVFGRLLLVIED